MMKKAILFSALLLLAGCTRTMNNIHKEPNFEALVVESGEHSILVEAADGEEERRSSDLFSVSLDVELEDSMTHFEVGDTVQIYYDGSIAESYPAQIHTVYAITLTEPAVPEEMLTYALEESGFTVESYEEDSPFFTESAVRLVVESGAQIILYPFEDREETDAAIKKIGHGGSEIPGNDGNICIVDWVDVPHFYRYSSSIVQYVGSDEMILSVLDKVCSEKITG